MRDVQAGLIKPEYLSRASELEASRKLHSKSANIALEDATQAPTAARRKEFRDSAKQHIQAAIRAGQEQYQMSTVSISKSKFTDKSGQTKPEAN